MSEKEEELTKICEEYEPAIRYAESILGISKEEAYKNPVLKKIFRNLVMRYCKKYVEAMFE